jgi:putative flippase GtrA
MTLTALPDSSAAPLESIARRRVGTLRGCSPPLVPRSGSAPEVTPARRPLFERLACSLGVSVATTVVSNTILVLLAVGAGLAAGPANAIGVIAGIPLSYLGNRRWVWRRSGRSGFVREVLPFWVMCLLGLVVSTAVVGRVGALTAFLPPAWRAVILPLASMATFGVLWVVQFVLLDRVIFAHRTSPGRAAATPDLQFPTGRRAA